MNCMVFDGFGRMGLWLSMGAPSIHNMLDLSRAKHVHFNNHYGIVMSWVWLCWLPTFN